MPPRRYRPVASPEQGETFVPPTDIDARQAFLALLALLIVAAALVLAIVALALSVDNKKRFERHSDQSSIDAHADDSDDICGIGQPQTPKKRTYHSNPFYPTGYKHSIDQPFWSQSDGETAFLRSRRSHETVLFEQRIQISTTQFIYNASGNAKPYFEWVPAAGGRTLFDQTFDARLQPSGSLEELWIQFISYDESNEESAAMLGTYVNTTLIRTRPMYPAVSGHGNVTWAILQKVRIRNLYLGLSAGGMDIDPVYGGTVIIKTRVRGTVPNPGWLLRMSKKQPDGRWLEFVPEVDPATPNPNQHDSLNVIAFNVRGLEADATYGYQIVDPSFDLRTLGFPLNLSNPFYLYWLNTVGRGYEMGRFVMPSAITNNEQDVYFGASGCNGAGAVIGSVLDGVEDQRMHFFVHTGDFIYIDQTTVPQIATPFDTADPIATTRSQVQEMFDENWRTPQFRRLTASTGFYGVVGDHEVADNWAGRPVVTFGYGTSNASEAAVYNAIATGPAFTTNRGYLPNRYIGTPTSPAPWPIVPEWIVFTVYEELNRRSVLRPQSAIAANRRYFKQHWGCVDLFAIDNEPTVDLLLQTVTYQALAGEFWPSAQIAWLKAELLASTALVKVVASGFDMTMFSVYQPEYKAKYIELAVAAGFGADIAEASFNKLVRYWLNAFMDGYPQQLNEITTFIEVNNIKNVITVGGDNHVSTVRYSNLTSPIINIHANALGTRPGRAVPVTESSWNNGRVLAATEYNNYVTAHVQCKCKTATFVARHGAKSLFDVSIKLK